MLNECAEVFVCFRFSSLDIFWDMTLTKIGLLRPSWKYFICCLDKFHVRSIRLIDLLFTTTVCVFLCWKSHLYYFFICSRTCFSFSTTFSNPICKQIYTAIFFFLIILAACVKTPIFLAIYHCLNAVSLNKTCIQPLRHYFYPFLFHFSCKH